MLEQVKGVLQFFSLVWQAIFWPGKCQRCLGARCVEFRLTPSVQKDHQSGSIKHGEWASLTVGKNGHHQLAKK